MPGNSAPVVQYGCRHAITGSELKIQFISHRDRFIIARISWMHNLIESFKKLDK